MRIILQAVIPIFILLVSMDLGAAIFKCEIDGAFVWQDKECPSESKQEVVNVREQNPIKAIGAGFKGGYLNAYKLIGGSIDVAARSFSEKVNSGGTFHSENDEYSLTIESSSDVVSFVSLGFKSTSHCSQNQNYNHIDYIRLLGLDITLMKKIKETAYYADSYNDFNNRLKVTFMCPFDGGEYTASFSQKYFNQ
jgi:hypothetical protein